MAASSTPQSRPTDCIVSDGELTVATLESELAPMAAKWETLGRKLRLQEWRLAVIAADHPVGDGASTRRLSAVLDQWLKNVTNGSWRDIICALKEMEENVLAKDIEMRYCKISRDHLQVSLGVVQQKRSEEALALLRTNELTMKDRFAQLQTLVYEKIQQRLNAREIKFKNFWVYMTTLFPRKECIPETADVSKIFAAITNDHLWDYLNYEPLVRVAKMYGGKDTDLTEKLKAYTQDLVGYKLVTKMADHLSDVPITNTSDSEDEDESSPLPVRKDRHFRKKLMVKLNIPIKAQSLVYIDEIWDSLSEVFRLPPSSAILEKIIEGSIYIVWLIPALFVPQIMEIAEQPNVIKVFRKMRINLIIVDGACIFEEQVEQEDSSDNFFNEDQESPPKPEGLATTIDFPEENVELKVKQYHDTQVESSHGSAEAATVKVVDEPPEPLLRPQPHSHGYDVDLVMESPDLHCPICLLVYCNPMQVSCCGKRFCQACIQFIILERKPCPACKCKARDYDVFEDKGQKQAVLDVKVHCSNRNIGCGWKGDLSQLDNHLNFDPEKGMIDKGCQYTKIKCIHCSEEHQRRHMRSCPKRLFICPYCKHYTSTYEDISSYHLSVVCEEFPVQCKACSMKIPRKSLQHHHLECEYQSTAISLKLGTIEMPVPVFISPPNIIMPNFTSLKEHRVPWYSSPFYSHIGGYKMCLRVDANGDESGKDTHVSVFVCLMQGEYDDHLAWPFIGDITVQLINQRGQEHVEGTIIYHDEIPDDCAGRVTEGVIALKGLGYDFIPHSVLHYDDVKDCDREYLKNDSLEFQITEVKLRTEGLLTKTEQSENLAIDVEESAVSQEKLLQCSTMQGLSQTLCESQQEQNKEAVALFHTNKLIMKEHFTQLQATVYHKIQNRLNVGKIKTKNFRVYMTNLFPTGEHIIPNTVNVSEIFAAITNNHLWDYLNCQPLVRVARMYGGRDPDLMTKLEAYSKDLIKYKVAAKTMFDDTKTGDVEESFPSPIKKAQCFYQEFTVKFKISTIAQPLVYVDKIWNSLSEVFHLPHSSAILDKVKAGPFCVTWLIPTFFVVQMMEIAEQPEVVKFFRKMEVEMIIVADVCLHESSHASEVQYDTKYLSSKPAAATDSFQEEGTDTAAAGELQEIPLDQSPLDLAEAAAVKSVNDDFLPHHSSYPKPHSHPHSPLSQVACYNVELVQESADLRCSICLLILRNPMQVNCCGKRFCQACIEATIVEAKPCPSCKCETGDYDIFEDKGQKQAILEVEVHCSNRKVGCDWKGELYQLENHLNLNPDEGKIELGCQYTELKCTYCSEDSQRRHMSCHLRSCPQQPYTCPYCKHYTSSYEDVNNCHFSACKEFPVQCKVCSVKMPRKSFQHHCLRQNIATPLTIETPSPLFVSPPNFIMRDFTSHKENEEGWHSPPFHSHIGGYKMCLLVIAGGYQNCAGTHVSVYVCLMRGEYDENLTWPFRGDITLQLVNCNQRWDEGHVEDCVSFNDSTPDESACRVMEGEISKGWGSHNFIPHSALHYDKSWNTKYLKNDCLEFRVTQVTLSKTTKGLPTEAQSQQSRNTARMNSKEPKLHSIPPMNIVMSNFISHEKRNLPWFSPPFYSHKRGYKMCLQVHANGYGSSTGTHVSVMVCLMQGEYDDKLVWPFRGDITVQLVNQNGKRHMEHILSFSDSTPDDCTGRVTDGNIAEGWGIVKFISHSILHHDKFRNTEYKESVSEWVPLYHLALCYIEGRDTQYLKYDCLEFRVTQVRLTSMKVTQ